VVKAAGAFSVGGAITQTAPGGFVSRSNSVAGNTLLASRLTGDATDRFTIQAGGNLYWSDGTNASDINFIRSAANQLTIAGSPSGNLSVQGYIVLTGAGTGYFGAIYQATASTVGFAARVTGDTANRWSVSGDGTHGWGPSAGPQDVTLARSGVGALSLTGSLASSSKFLAPDGTAAAPSYTFTSDTASGLFRAANEMSMVVAGLNTIRIGKTYANSTISLHGAGQAQYSRVYMGTLSGDQGVVQTHYGLFLQDTWQPTNELSQTSVGVFGRIIVHDGSSTGNLAGTYQGILASALANSQTNVRTVNGLYAIVGQVGSVNSNAPAGTISTAIGCFLQNLGFYQNVSILYGLYVYSNTVGTPTGGTAAIITTAYGIRVANQGTTGGTTSYGLYIDAQTTAATAWAIYSVGGNSAHAGNLRIGSTVAPTSTLDVTGTFHVTGASTFDNTVLVPISLNQTTIYGLRVGNYTYGMFLQNGANNSYNAYILHNAYMTSPSGSETFNWAATHASFGSRGIRMSGVGIDFYADSVATTQDATFTPTRRMNIANGGAVTIDTGSLTLTSGGISAGSSISANGTISMTSGNGYFGARSMGATSNAVFVSRLTADTVDRFVITCDGTQTWGPGTSATDVTLARTATSTMTLTGALKINGNIGFYNATPVAKPTVSGAKASNAALTSLMTALSSLGIVTDSTT
jgi:hypothetical protein